MVFSGSVPGGGRGGVCPRRNGVRVAVGVVTVMIECGLSHSHELGEEEKKDGHENDAFDPVIFRNGSRQTRVLESLMGRCKQLCHISLIGPIVRFRAGLSEQARFARALPAKSPSSRIYIPASNVHV